MMGKGSCLISNSPQEWVGSFILQSTLTDRVYYLTVDKNRPGSLSDNDSGAGYFTL